MAYFEIPESPDYDDRIEKLTTGTIGHADVWNVVYERIIQNIAYIHNAVNALKGSGDGSVTKLIAAEVAKIISDAPEDFDTLKEISDWIESHQDSAAAMNQAINDLRETKLDKTGNAASATNADKLDGKHASEFEESDMFLAYLASNNNGPLCLLSQTVGDTITTNGRSAINSKGVRTLIFNGSLYSAFNASSPYGGHVVLTTDGTSWEDNDANDNYGMQSGEGEAFTTPAGNTVYMKTMAGTWGLAAGFPVTAVLNGKTYTIKTRTLFRYSPSSLKWALELADFYLFKTNLSLINYNNVMPLINGIKSLSTVGTLGYGTNNDYIPNIACLSFWNGKYNDNGSNLAYCNKGAFGDIVTHAASEFLSVNGGTIGDVTFTPDGDIRHANTRKDQAWTVQNNAGANVFGINWETGAVYMSYMGVYKGNANIFYIGGNTAQENSYPHLKFTQFTNSLQILPTQVNQCTIGHTSIPFESVTAKNIYNSSGLITSSDRNKKKDFENITQGFAEQIINGLVPTSFKYKDGNSDRTHYGLVAQDVEKLLEKLEIDSKDFAPLIKNYPTKEVENENGSKSLETDYEAEPEYFLRYEGFIGLIIKYIQGLKQENIALKDKMSSIEDRLELLEGKINSI